MSQAVISERRSICWLISFLSAAPRAASASAWPTPGTSGATDAWHARRGPNTVIDRCGTHPKTTSLRRGPRAGNRHGASDDRSSTRPAPFGLPELPRVQVARSYQSYACLDCPRTFEATFRHTAADQWSCLGAGRGWLRPPRGSYLPRSDRSFARLADLLAATA